MSARSFSLGMTPASEFLLALTITITRIGSSPYSLVLTVWQRVAGTGQRLRLQRGDERDPPGSTRGRGFHVAHWGSRAALGHQGEEIRAQRVDDLAVEGVGLLFGAAPELAHGRTGEPAQPAYDPALLDGDAVVADEHRRSRLPASGQAQKRPLARERAPQRGTQQRRDQEGHLPVRLLPEPRREGLLGGGARERDLGLEPAQAHAEWPHARGQVAAKEQSSRHASGRPRERSQAAG